MHRDILEGRDTEIGWEDVFVGEFILFWLVMCGEMLMCDTGNEMREVPDFHSEVEARMKMNW